MTLDLITELNIQRFIQLADMPDCCSMADMCWKKEKYETYLNYRDRRLHISQCLPRGPFDNDLLMLALQRWHPAYFAGIPQRFFKLRCGLFISCSPAAESTAELWFRLHRRQQAFLESLCKSPS
ncbi:type III secretion system protein SsaM [Lonsdalea iberica]|uniref:Type III secretion system protein SsaM n=1 Tax=Lonsdalea iberica TaxID=1082703 RepID=A0ABX3XHT3_9GAMM|nr:type III secretion system protein SsaM [Lonsdalea iberica]OSN10901.1 type III secretion system protein SsaM [Lonsdalea iberica]